MDTRITYTNHKGESLTFGSGDDLHYFEHELMDYEWSYSERNGRIAAIVKDIQEKSFPVGIAAETEAQGLAIRNRLYEIADIDVMAMSPGVLTIGDWALECYVIRSEADMYWMDDRYAEFDLTLLVESSFWIKQITHTYSKRTGQGEANNFLNFPYNFKYNYTRKWTTQSVTNDAMSSCDFILRVYGPAVKPYVMIADNIYEVDVTVPVGARLEINSREQTIRIIDEAGRITNVYNARKLGRKGSGSYIFEKIPTGYSVISWSNGFSFDLVLLCERSVPEWVA